MYDESSNFVMGCVMDDSMMGQCLLTTIENSHRLDFTTLNNRRNDGRLLGVLKSDWLSGLEFTLVGYQNNRNICSIRSVKLVGD